MPQRKYDVMILTEDECVCERGEIVKDGNSRRKGSGTHMATIRSWFTNFTIVYKIEGMVLIELHW